MLNILTITEMKIPSLITMLVISHHWTLDKPGSAVASCSVVSALALHLSPLPLSNASTINQSIINKGHVESRDVPYTNLRLVAMNAHKPFWTIKGHHRNSAKITLDNSWLFRSGWLLPLGSLCLDTPWFTTLYCIPSNPVLPCSLEMNACICICVCVGLSFLVAAGCTMANGHWPPLSTIL